MLCCCRNSKGLGGTILMEGGKEEWETAIQSISAVGNETLHRIGPGAEEKEQIWEK